jgi:hypothetical protein
MMMSASGASKGVSSGQATASGVSSGSFGGVSASGTPSSGDSLDAPSETGFTGEVSGGSLDGVGSGAPEDAIAASGSATSSGNVADTDAGGETNDASDCLNPLGSVWTVTESGRPCTSTWTRQGTTSTFTYKQGAPCNVTATLTVTITGPNVAAFSLDSSDNADCDYLGSLSGDCASAMGVYTCLVMGGASGTWTATIQP